MKTGFKLQASSYKLIVSLACGLGLAACGVFLSGCASTTALKSISKPISVSEYIDIETFCAKYNFEYNFDTVDDIIKIFSSDKEIKLLLNSPVGTFGGAPISFKKHPVYFNGKILLPRQLEKVISSKKFVSFKPLFEIKTIVIDPGHGGKDPGAISKSGFMEKDINLTVSKYLKEKLEKQGFQVILTRSRDTYLSLAQRVSIAEKHSADLFISIHANSNNSVKVNGAEIYYLLPSKVNSYERAVKLAKSEDFKGKVLPYDVKAILWDLLISKNYSFSVELSNVLYFNFKSLGFNIKPPKKAPFYVLRFARTPSVLVEMGYLSNYYEEKALRKRHYQEQIAEAIALSIFSLKKRYTNLAVNTDDHR